MKNLIKHVPYKCKVKFDGKKCNSNQKRNNDKRKQCPEVLFKKVVLKNSAKLTGKHLRQGIFLKK